MEAGVLVLLTSLGVLGFSLTRPKTRDSVTDCRWPKIKSWGEKTRTDLESFFVESGIRD